MSGQSETVVVLGSYGPSLILFRGPMIAELVERGHRVVAIASGIERNVERQLQALGAEVREVKFSNNTINPFTIIATFASLKALFGKIAPTVVIAYTIQPVTIGALAAQSIGVPKIVSLITGLGYAFGTGGGVRQKLGRWGARMLYRLALRHSSAIIFQNPDDQQDLRALGLLPEGIPTPVVGGSGVDLDAFSPCPLPAYASFIMVARLTKSKGVPDYAAAVAALKRRYPTARFRLAGWFDESADGLSRADLQPMIDSGLDFLGKLRDVRPALADSTVFVLPSLYREGVPHSALEAMSMARPVITYDMPGCRETVIDGKTGFLLPRGDVAALERAMEQFIVDPSLAEAMGLESRALAERRFDVRAVNRAILDASRL